MSTDDGWTLAPSGWAYRVRVDYYEGEAVAKALIRHNDRDFYGNYETWGPEGEHIPPCDRELVRSLWEAKDD